MSKNLSEIVARLRAELNELTRVYIDKRHEENTLFMVQSQALSQEIDNLEAFILVDADERCLYVLRQKMSMCLDRQETKTLILDVGISDFDYTGDSIAGMHAQLVSYCERHRSTPQLIKFLKSIRPRVSWPDC